MENKRFDYRTELQIIVDHMQCSTESEGMNCRGYILEISASGCKLESETELKAGQVITASFVLAQGHSIVNAKIHVVRTLGKDKKYFIAAGQFLNLSENDQNKIREFVVWKEAQQEMKA